MMRVKSRGSSGLSSDTERGVSLRIAESTARLLSPVNGRMPVASS